MAVLAQIACSFGLLRQHLHIGLGPAGIGEDSPQIRPEEENKERHKATFQCNLKVVVVEAQDLDVEEPPNEHGNRQYD